MAYRGQYRACNVCPIQNDCRYCSEGHRDNMNRGNTSIDIMDLVGVAAGIATGFAVSEAVESIFDIFD